MGFGIIPSYTVKILDIFLITTQLLNKSIINVMNISFCY